MLATCRLPTNIKIRPLLKREEYGLSLNWPEVWVSYQLKIAYTYIYTHIHILYIYNIYTHMYISLSQGLANYGPWVNSDTVYLYENVLLGHRHTHPLLSINALGP